jgi:hypothetical protein
MSSGVDPSDHLRLFFAILPRWASTLTSLTEIT